jgi:hypothetical protein
MLNAAFCDVTLCGFLRPAVSEKHVASIFRVEKSSGEEKYL